MMSRASSSFSSILSPVPEFANGVLNHSWNDLTELKTLSKRAQVVLQGSTDEDEAAS